MKKELTNINDEKIITQTKTSNKDLNKQVQLNSEAIKDALKEIRI